MIDDGSTIDLSPVLDVPLPTGLEVRVERQEPSGLTVGRNHGAAVARSEIVAYLDDDVLVPPHWAREVVTAFDRGCDGLAGRIEVLLEGERPSWLTEENPGYLGGYDRGDEPEWIVGDPFPFGGNCAVRKETLDRVGGFREGLGRDGASLLGNEDIEFFRRVHDSGGRLLYWPWASVQHRIPPARLTLDFFRRRAYAQGLTDGLTVAYGRPSERAGELARLTQWSARLPLSVAKGLVLRRGLAGSRMRADYLRGRWAARSARASETAHARTSQGAVR